MNESGEGVQQDYTKAMEYYAKSADKGLAHSQYRIGSYLVLFISNYLYNHLIRSRGVGGTTKLSQSNGIFPEGSKPRSCRCTI